MFAMLILAAAAVNAAPTTSAQIYVQPSYTYCSELDLKVQPGRWTSGVEKDMRREFERFLAYNHAHCAKHP